jgi:hypothetical protein
MCKGAICVVGRINGNPVAEIRSGYGSHNDLVEKENVTHVVAIGEAFMYRPGAEVITKCTICGDTFSGEWVNEYWRTSEGVIKYITKFGYNDDLLNVLSPDIRASIEKCFSFLPDEYKSGVIVEAIKAGHVLDSWKTKKIELASITSTFSVFSDKTGFTVSDKVTGNTVLEPLINSEDSFMIWPRMFDYTIIDNILTVSPKSNK